MKSYFGSFYIPGQVDAEESTVLVFDTNLSIGYRLADGTPVSVNWLLKDISSVTVFGRQDTRLRNNKFPGHELLIEGKDADQFIREMQTEQQKPWYLKNGGREWIRNSLLFLGILGFLFLLYLLIVPWLSSGLASKISVNSEQQLGNAVYDAMGLAGQEDTAASYELNRFFTEMEVPTAYPIRITVIKDNMVNAFALPGGRIVVYSALLKQINSYPELAALLSHEFIHINNKHTTRSIFRRLGSKVFLGLLFGNFGTVTSILVDHADNLKSLNYSRRLEKEADTEGLSILAQRKIDPQGFVSLLEHLKRASPGNELPEFLGSHPDIDKRIAYIKESSAGLEVVDNTRLKAIFEKLNNHNP